MISENRENIAEVMSKYIVILKCIVTFICLCICMSTLNNGAYSSRWDTAGNNNILVNVEICDNFK